MGLKYSLTLENNSSKSGAIGIYQRMIECGEESYSSTVWLASMRHPGTRVRFEWNTDYCFAWTESGLIKTGGSYIASGILAADPNDPKSNSTGFSRIDGAYEFTAPRSTGTLGQLQIQTDGSIPSGGASVGIGMWEKPTFITAAQPGVTYSISTNTEYWVIFGDFEERDIIDFNTMKHATVRAEFPANVYSMSMSYNEDDTWSRPLWLAADADGDGNESK